MALYQPNRSHLSVGHSWAISPSSEMSHICLCDAAICGGKWAVICEGLTLSSLNFFRVAGKTSALPTTTAELGSHELERHAGSLVTGDTDRLQLLQRHLDRREHLESGSTTRG